MCYKAFCRAYFIGGNKYMLAITYMPFIDEMPISWLNRLAKSNGFEDVEDLAFILSIYKYRHRNNMKLMNHFEEFIEKIDFSKRYQQELEEYIKIMKTNERLIGDLSDKNIKVCPICMKEEIEKFGQFYHHFQHQFAGSSVCWKHNVNLNKISQLDYLETNPMHIQLSPIKGTYDAKREIRILGMFDENPQRFLEEMIRYRLEVLIDLNGLSIDDMESFLSKSFMYYDIYKKSKILLTNPNLSPEFDKQELVYLLRLLFDDWYKFSNILDKATNDLSISNWINEIILNLNNGFDYA